MEISTELNEYRLQGTVSFLSIGAGPCVLQFFGGPRLPLGTAPTGAMLAEIVLPDPIGTISGGVLALAASDEVMISATGEAVWARALNGNGDTAFHCSVSKIGEGGELQIPETLLYAGNYTRLVYGVLG